MASVIEIAKMISVLAGAAILGQWFLTEFKKASRRGLPWYAPYLTPPGMLILLAMSLPLIYWLARP